MKKLLLYNILIFLAFAVYTGSVNQALGETRDVPFHVGEKISFQVRWAGILAGEATLELLPLDSLNNTDSYHFILTTRTSEFVDIFYKVRDRMESYTDLDMTHSLLYIQSHQTKPQKDSRINFDWKKLQAQYSQVDDGKKRKPISIVEGTFDPLSVFYAFRLIDLKGNSSLTIPVTDGKRTVLGRVNVIKRETIKVSGIDYDTFLVEPELGQIGGVFEKDKDASIQIWVTADDRCIPVRIKSKVTVGSFVAEISSYDGGAKTGKAVSQ